MVMKSTRSPAMGICGPYAKKRFECAKYLFLPTSFVSVRTPTYSARRRVRPDSSRDGKRHCAASGRTACRRFCAGRQRWVQRRRTCCRRAPKRAPRGKRPRGKSADAPGDSTHDRTIHACGSATEEARRAHPSDRRDVIRRMRTHRVHYGALWPGDGAPWRMTQRRCCAPSLHDYVARQRGIVGGMPLLDLATKRIRRPTWNEYRQDGDGRFVGSRYRGIGNNLAAKPQRELWSRRSGISELIAKQGRFIGPILSMKLLLAKTNANKVRDIRAV